MPKSIFGLLVGVLLSMLGCSSKSDVALAAVHGRITLNGEPLSNARIVFVPQGSRGGPAFAVSNRQGEYEMQYTHDKKGAVIGGCLVRINTATRPSEDDAIPPAPELVPPKYNTESTLKVEVAPDGGPYDFALLSE